jgi:hypothetical protein
VTFQGGKFVTRLDGNIIEELFETADAIEIIGNIYEYPELLSV